MKYLNTFIKAKNLDKQMVLDYLQGEDPRRTYPLYHTPLVPTFAGSLDIFELKQLEKIKVETKQSQGGQYVAIVQLYDKRNDLSRAGASQDRDEGEFLSELTIFPPIIDLSYPNPMIQDFSSATFFLHDWSCQDTPSSL